MNLPHVFIQDKKLMIKVIAGIILIAVAFAFYFMKNAGSEDDMVLSGISETVTEAGIQTTEAAVAEKVMIIVDVGGAVKSPCVAELPEGSRVYEAVEKAGGFSEDAEAKVINQAEILTDGQKVYIPTKKEVAGETGQTAQSTSSKTSSYAPVYSTGSSRPSKININTADSTALQELTGVGPATAEKIINYRNENGKFNTIEDLKNVSGIGDKTYEKLKDKITV